MRWKVGLLLGMFTGILYGQPYTGEDSLLFKLKSEQNDLLKIEIYEALIGETYLNAPSKAHNYSKQLIDLSARIDNKMGLASGYSWLGFMEEQSGNVELGLEYYFKATKIFKALDSLPDLGACYNNIATIYANQGEHDLAMQYFWESIEINLQFDNTEVVAASLNNIGRIYYLQGNVREALELYYKALYISEANDFKRMASSSIYNIANVYYDQKHYKVALDNYFRAFEIERNLGDKFGMAYSLRAIGNVYEKVNRDADALKYYQKSEELLDEIGNPQGLGSLFIDIGYIYYKMKNWDICLMNYNKGLKYLEEVNDKQGVATATFRLGECYYYRNNTEMALAYLLRSYQLSEELGYPENIRNSAGLLYKVYEDKEEKIKAFEVYKRYTIMNDSIENDESRKLVQQQKLQFEFEKEKILKDQEEEQRRKLEAAKTARRNVLQNSLIFLTILMAFAAIFSFGFLKISPRLGQVLVFGSLLILFEFLLLLTDPYLDGITNGIPIYKLLANSILAFSIFPLHAILEKKLKNKVNKLK